MTLRRLKRLEDMIGIPVGLTWGRKYMGGWKAFLHLQWGPRTVAEWPTSPRCKRLLVKVETNPMRLTVGVNARLATFPSPAHNITYGDFRDFNVGACAPGRRPTY